MASVYASRRGGCGVVASVNATCAAFWRRVSIWAVLALASSENAAQDTAVVRNIEIKDGFMVFSPGFWTVMGHGYVSIVRSALSKALPIAKSPQALRPYWNAVRQVDPVLV